MGKKINVGILSGGKSAEHEVSLRSAKNVIKAIDKRKYNPISIRINKSGSWVLDDDNKKVALVPQSKGKISILSKGGFGKSVDVVFPILHGPFCEDGTIQGLLKLANIPFVGASILGSAVGMDKDVMKRLLRDAGIPIGKFLSFKAGDSIKYSSVIKELGTPVFVKPANLGSSVGISKVKSKNEFKKAVKQAFEYDLKIVIEENINGREIECSVLGNDKPIASALGEIVPNQDFYSYEAKYMDEDGADLKMPAEIPKRTAETIKKLAVQTFKVLSCEGLARVDFFLKKNGKIIVNEINTIPGFTSISMYPKLWEISGISYTELIDKLIQLAFERFNKEQKLKTSYIE